MNIKEAIKEKTVINCETESEAKHSIILADEDIEKAAKERSRNE